MLNIVCVKRGTAFDPIYVNRLYAMVERHLTLPHRFICLTENSNGINPSISVAPFIDMSLERWWNKLELFKPHPILENNRTLFFDLDTVIVNNIDDIASYNGEFAILHDLFAARRGPVRRPSIKQPHRGQWLGSAIMSIAPGFGEFIWKGLIQEKGRIKYYPGDQQFIAKKFIDTKYSPDIWQELYPGKIHSFKASVLDRTFKDHFDKGMSIVCFHGKPRPHEVNHLDWMKEHWR